MGPHEDVTPEHDTASEESAESTSLLADSLKGRMERKKAALEVARAVLSPTAMFGTAQPMNPFDLLVLADWVLDESGGGEQVQTPQPWEVNLDSLPSRTVAIDHEGLAYQRESETWVRVLDSTTFTSQDLVENYGVQAIYVPGGERYGG